MNCAVIGIIGEAGSGKTYNTKYLAQRLSGVHIEGDRLGHDALRDEIIKEKIVAAFGKDVLDSDSEINRKALGQIVFSDHRELMKLNAISHPYILAQIKALIKQYENLTDYIFIEGAALIEAGVDKLCHQVVYLYAPADIRIKRLVKGRDLSVEKAISIIKAQEKSAYFRELATITFDTSAGDDNMREEIVEYFRSLHETY